MNAQTGGAAFPCGEMLTPDGRFIQAGQQGMTMRDYFAAKALQGICASAPGDEWTDARIAQGAYGLADAMLRAREGGAP